MAPLRQKLIHVLASIVAIDLAVAGVVIDYRSGSASAASPAALKAPVTAGGVVSAGDGGGILGAAPFRHRRAAGATTATTAAPGSSEVAAGPPGGSTSSTSGVPATGSTTATTGRPRATGGSGTATTGGRTTGPSGNGAQTGAPAGGASDPGALPGDGGGSDPGGSGDQTVTPPAGGTDTTPTTAGGSVQPTNTPPVKGPASRSLTDRTGDTVADGTSTPMAQPQADIIKAQADWSAKALVFAVQTAQSVNPAQDKNWASDSTYITWDLDTTGDGAPDWEIQYFFDAKGGLVADVSKYGDTSGTSACGGEAGYTADGYTVAVDPACIGNPAAVTFKVTTYYDPNPADPNGNLASDTTPDGGMSGPVSKP